jgi:hypothetical protein
MMDNKFGCGEKQETSAPKSAQPEVKIPPNPDTPEQTAQSTRDQTKTILDQERQLVLLAKSSVSIGNADQIIPLILQPGTRDKEWAQITLDKLISSDHFQIHILQALEHLNIPKDDPYYEKTFQKVMESPFKEGALIIKHFWEWLKDKSWAESILTRHLQSELDKKSSAEVMDLLLGIPLLAQRVLSALCKTNPQFILTNQHKFRGQPWSSAILDEIPDSFLEKILAGFGSKACFNEEILPCPTLALKVAKKSPKLFLTLAQNMKEIPDGAEPAFREAAKHEPRQALLCSTHFWAKPWGHEIVEEALGKVALSDFEPDALRSKPWYSCLGLRLISEKKGKQPENPSVSTPRDPINPDNNTG